MRKILTVARKEFIEMIKTKAFLLMAFFAPVMITVIILIIGRLEKSMKSGPQPPRRIVVTDLSGELLPELDSRFEDYNEANPQRQILLEPSSVEGSDLEAYTERIKQGVRERHLDAYLIIPKDVLDGGGRPRYYLREENLADLNMFGIVRGFLNDGIVDRRSVRHNLSPELLAEIRQRVPIDKVDVKVSRGGKQADFTTRLMVPFFFMFLMFMGMFGTNQHMLTSVIEEKNSRVVEVILSAVSPFEFMAGKILGLSLCSLGVVCLWGLAAYGAAAYRGLGGMIEAVNLGYFFLYFILGFLLFSSIFAAIGSACNTIKEAQSLVMPISMMLIVPMVGWFYFYQHPEGALATVLSFVPPMTPLLMMLRLAARPDLPMIQVVASILVLAGSVPVVVWASAKIFRTGILMYGKPPSLRELLRWVRFN